MRTFLNWIADVWEEYDWIVIVLGIGVGLILMLAFATHESPAEKQALYESWCRTNSNWIPYEDWERLRSKELLPGQTKSGRGLPHSRPDANPLMRRNVPTSRQSSLPTPTH